MVVTDFPILIYSIYMVYWQLLCYTLNQVLDTEQVIIVIHLFSLMKWDVFFCAQHQSHNIKPQNYMNGPYLQVQGWTELFFYCCNIKTIHMINTMEISACGLSYGRDYMI